MPPKKALVWLLGLTMLISGTAALALLFYRHVQGQYANDDTYRIVAIVQATPSKEPLKTVYLTEILGLSVDKPDNLYRFNSVEARRKLLASALIKEAKVKKIRPGMIYVDYELRTPIAFLIDYTNTAIDENWVPMPFKPFFTPKKLPEVYLGIANRDEGFPVSGGEWGVRLEGDHVALAKEILAHLNERYIFNKTHLKRIDVSNAFSSSYGQRQIVVILEEEVMRVEKGNSILIRLPRIVRLSTENYAQGLANYFALQPTLLSKMSDLSADNQSSVVNMPATIIDLRLNHLGYIKQTLQN